MLPARTVTAHQPTARGWCNNPLMQSFKGYLPSATVHFPGYEYRSISPMNKPLLTGGSAKDGALALMSGTSVR